MGSESLLRSIYGSQASQLLFSDYGNEQFGGERDRFRPAPPPGLRASTSLTNLPRRRMRPQSSPVATLASRTQMRQYAELTDDPGALQEELEILDVDSDLELASSSHLPSSAASRTSLPNVRPGSAAVPRQGRPLGARPASASVSGPGGRPSRVRPASAAVSGQRQPPGEQPASAAVVAGLRRPASAAKQRRPPSASTLWRFTSTRPQTALGIVSCLVTRGWETSNDVEIHICKLSSLTLTTMQLHSMYLLGCKSFRQNWSWYIAPLKFPLHSVTNHRIL